jgi:hypothetical protein
MALGIYKFRPLFLCTQGTQTRLSNLLYKINGFGESHLFLSNSLLDITAMTNTVRRIHKQLNLPAIHSESGPHKKHPFG